MSHDRHRRLLDKFIQAAQSGYRAVIKSLLADDVQLVGDGGGKVPSFMKILCGADRIANLYWANSKRRDVQPTYRYAQINVEPGLLRYFNDRLESAQAFAIANGQIVAIYAIRNPDKLAGIAPLP